MSDIVVSLLTHDLDPAIAPRGDPDRQPRGIWIYQDARKRRMDTADMWAVGFGVAFFLLPIIGGVAVFFYYLHRRNGGGPRQYASHQQWE